MLFDVAWMNRAECQKADPELFFPIGNGRLTPDQVAEARAVCGRCPVSAECLRYSLDTAQGHGIWGGTDEEERRLMRTKGKSRRDSVSSGRR